jgi:hypothetical protein
MGEFFRRALTDENFRGKVREVGEEPADMLAFMSEVWLNAPDCESREALMIAIHTAERSFRSVIEIETSPKRCAHYVPLQIEMSFSGERTEADSHLSLKNMPATMPALESQHPRHDLHLHATDSIQ